MIFTLGVHLFIITNSILCNEISNTVPSQDRRKHIFRIVGGRYAMEKESPYLCSLQRFQGVLTKHICGTVIATKVYLLTAGHCTYKIVDREIQLFEPEEFKLMCGSIYLGEGQSMDIFKFFLHPEHDEITFKYDVGAIATMKDLEFTPTIMPAVFPIGSFEESSRTLGQMENDGEICQVYGWGGTRPRSTFILRVVDIPLEQPIECAKIFNKYSTGFVINETYQLCALEHSMPKDACQGDSGGPLVNKHIVWGLVSWGIGCARKNMPGVYVRTDFAMNWLENGVMKIPLDGRSSASSHAYPNEIFYILSILVFYILFVII